MLQQTTKQLLPQSSSDLDRIRKLEDIARGYPQEHIETQHVFHAGMYTRTIEVPANVLITGAPIKIPTVVTVSGDVTVYAGEEPVLLQGFNVLRGQPGRKNVFLTHSKTYISMAFPTSATTIEEAENEFTDEAEFLLSRQQNKGD